MNNHPVLLHLLATTGRKPTTKELQFVLVSC
jgi:hypothetical protein